MANERDIFINVPQIGNLFVIDVLLYYIYPRIFVCDDEYNCRYLFFEITEDLNLDKWLVTKLKVNEYFDILDGKIFAQSLFQDRNCYMISKDYNNNGFVNIKVAEKNDILLLPKEKFFYKEMNVNDVSEETLLAARKNNSSVCDFRFFRGTTRHSISCDEMKDLCRDMPSLFNSINKNTSQIRVSTLVGSCIVRFDFCDQINLFNESSSSYSLQKFYNIVKTDNLVKEIEDVSDKKEFINSYSRLLKTISKIDGDVEIISASLNSKCVDKIILNNNQIKLKINDLANIYNIKKEEINIIGVLIAWDIKTKKFKINCNEEFITGKISDSINIESVKFVPHIYNFTLVKQSRIDKMDFTSKIDYTLIAMKQL